ncbi:MFS transporter [Streptomyces rimosus subsp. rimosus]|uniref:MFS transporter n=1 Tax=Streptomyces rimosus subsp. rimosus (strain ATCC 10970 / DSM 40260 / JCM 4667 / NRRL 2234) TaxID=1265868 RepID=A0A8A1UYV6_STRR1|nr:MFS transporter [Streptomyces rimosus subsp. rimosus]KOT43731.1 MFS transporter [Streptomyces sp. NRRL WC-3701]MYT46399.1 MFS transporter [Streptomyces sp. SID5471]QDA10085.1 MFS transporter [Streptomyces rimosus]QGY71303.1 MFS transporter [Streptomyces rimosus R6-500]QST85657.1 MFS transporter [Streptomyces rimosus subsp. rimosus ATCC 10970]
MNTDRADGRGGVRRPRRLPDWAGRNYTLLTSAAVVANLGSAGSLIAAAFAVLGTGGSATDVGLVATARTVPLVVFLLIGGAVADRLPRHRVMVAANALNCVSQGLFALLVLTGEARLWQMAVLAALGGTGQAFFAPASEGMVLSSVSGEHSGRAFAFFRMSMNGANIGGAALGGALVAAVGPGWVLAIDAAAFAVAGALRAFLDVGHIPERAPTTGLLRDLRDGWREVVSRPWLWAVIGQFAVVNAVVVAAEAVYGPMVAEEHLGGPRPWGLALAAFGAGTVGGALLMMRVKPRRILLTGVLCVFPLALPSAALAVPVPVPVLLLVMFGTGIALEVFGVLWMVALHQEIPEEKFSRVSSYDWFGSLAITPAATALAGPVQDLIGRTAALWGCSALIALLTAAALCVRDVRRLTRRSSGTPERRGAPETAPGTGAASADAEGPVGRAG